MENSLEIGSPQQVLKSTKQTMERMSHVTQQVNIEEFNPKEYADIHFNKNINIVDTLHHIGDIVFFSSSAIFKNVKSKRLIVDIIRLQL